MTAAVKRVEDVSSDLSARLAQSHETAEPMAGSCAVDSIFQQSLTQSELGPGLDTLAFFRDLVEYSPDGIIVVDPHGRIAFANKTCKQLLGYSEQELSGMTIEALVPGHIRAEHIHYRTSAANQSKPRSMGRLTHLEAQTKSGQCVPVDIAISPLQTKSGQFTVATVRDAKRQRELINLASTDPLTGALNRRSFYIIAERELERRHRYDTPVSVLMLDIDHFKNINDNYGHDAGDRTLVDMTRVCFDLLRKNDGFARLGGEEFVIIAPEIGVVRAKQMAERLRQTLAHIKIPAADRTFSFTVSIGVTEVTKNDMDINQSVKRADTALYKAKEAGRNRVVVAH